MNQILFSDHKNIINVKKNNKKRFKILLYISIILILCTAIYFLYFRYISMQKENISNDLLKTFNLERLYSSTASKTIYLNENSKYLVIGSIEIPTLSLNYPILSNANDDLLRIAPCRFYGPFPNEVGNLCIAGHNYDNNQFFSNLYKLNVGDEIRIYDSSNSLIKYYIYHKYETNKNDSSCISQDTNGKKEITLVTCNNLNGNRLILKAKE